MAIEMSFQRGFPVPGTRSAVPDLFDTPGLSRVSTFATPQPRSPAASAIGLISRDRPGDPRHCHEMIQPDVPSPSESR
jgi:hypothetical protein